MTDCGGAAGLDGLIYLGSPDSLHSCRTLNTAATVLVDENERWSTSSIGPWYEGLVVACHLCGIGFGAVAVMMSDMPLTGKVEACC